MTWIRRVAVLTTVGVFVAQWAVAADAVRVTGDRVNLRAEASTNSRIVATVAKGTVLKVLGQAGVWYQVAAPDSGAAVYIHNTLCEPTSSAAPGPAAAPAPPSQAPTASADTPAPRSSARSSGASDTSDEKRVRFGVHAGFATNDVGIGLGARAAGRIGLREGLGFLATFDYFFGESAEASEGGVSVSANTSYFQVDGYVTYSLKSAGVKPYFGAGVSYFHASGDVTVSVPGGDVGGSASGSQVSLGVVAGAKFAKRFFADARYHFGDADHLTFSTGILF